MRDMNIRGHAVFRGGDRIYSVNRRQEGYIVTPLEDDACQYLAVRFDDRMVFLYRVPDDIPNNIYPLRFYKSLLKKHLVVESAAPVESRFRPDTAYRRIDCVHYDYSGTVKVLFEDDLQTIPGLHVVGFQNVAIPPSSSRFTRQVSLNWLTGL